MKTLTAYQTNDGKLFDDEHAARLYESDCAKRIATSKLHQLVNEEFPENCSMTLTTVTDFLIAERLSITHILNKLEENLLEEDKKNI